MNSFEEVVSETRYRAAVRSAERVGSARVGISDMLWSPGRVQNIPARYSALTLYRSTATIKHEVAGEDRPSRRFTPGDLMLRPPNLDYVTEYHDNVEITVFALETELVQSATAAFGADVGAVFGRLEARPFRSPLAAGLAGQLAETANGNCDRLYADALTSALIHELWRMCSGSLHPSETSPRALPSGMVRRIDELIAECPGAQIALEQLAASVSMSTTAFSAALKAATGQTPYQYVLSRRLEHARDLVETTRLPLAEVAFRAGFSSQSHMTDVFRAKLGATPGKLRSGRA